MSRHLGTGNTINALRDIVDDNTDTTWVLFEYEKGSNNLKVSETGSDFEDLIYEINDGKVQFYYIKFIINELPKFVYVPFCGAGVEGMMKGNFHIHSTDFSDFIKRSGLPLHLTVNARSEADIDGEKMKADLKKAMGSDFDAGNKIRRELPTYVKREAQQQSDNKVEAPSHLSEYWNQKREAQQQSDNRVEAPSHINEYWNQKREAQQQSDNRVDAPSHINEYWNQKREVQQQSDNRAEAPSHLNQYWENKREAQPQSENRAEAPSHLNQYWENKREEDNTPPPQNKPPSGPPPSGPPPSQVSIPPPQNKPPSGPPPSGPPSGPPPNMPPSGPPPNMPPSGPPPNMPPSGPPPNMPPSGPPPSGPPSGPPPNMPPSGPPPDMPPSGPPPSMPPSGPPSRPPPPSNKECVIAVYDYGEPEGAQPGDLLFAAGDIIEVVEKAEDGWWTGILNGVTGVFPSNFTEPHH